MELPLSSSVSQTGRRAEDTTRPADQRQGGGEMSWTGLRGDRIQWERGGKGDQGNREASGQFGKLALRQRIARELYNRSK